MFGGLKATARLVRDLNTSKLELRQVRANFEAVLDQAQYRRRNAEQDLLVAVHHLERLLSPPNAVELDWPRDGYEARVMGARQFLAGLNSNGSEDVPR
jgi:hypothetical protein